MGGLAVALAACAAGVHAQQPRQPSSARDEPRRAIVSLLGGIGNMFGGLGAGVERYLPNHTLAGAVGVGVVPDTGDSPASVGVAAAVRAYTDGPMHRVFAELSLSLLDLDWMTVDGSVTNVDRHYGPGASFGYKYTAAHGFTLMAAAGVGWVLATGASHPVALFGLGHTWRW